MNTIWMNWLSLAMVSPILAFIDPVNLFRMFKIWREKRTGENCELTQREANKMMEPMEVYFPALYAQVGALMFYTSFYILIFPPGIIITIVGLFAYYWVQKVIS